MADINECAECSAKTEQPLVGILMGSNSDWEVMKNAAQMLKDFGVPFEARVAAHLPGMLAAKCTLPVCGVPVPSKYLRGVDSLHSIVQMPKGVPVATFAIGEAGAANAALYAVQILALNNPELSSRLADFRVAQNAKARAMTLPVDELA